MQTRFWAVFPSIATGLFIGRLLSEWFSLARLNISDSLINQLGLAVGLTIIAVWASIRVLREISSVNLWPLAGLLIYVLAPTQSLSWLGSALGFTALLFILQTKLFNNWDEASWQLHSGIIFLGLLFAGLYLFTLFPDILPADNGEFQLRATQLGVAHPPGFPLYTLLGYLMTLLPIGPSAAFRVNLFGLLCALATLLVVYNICFRLTRSSLAALLGAGMLGVATTFWAQATTANIRSLTALFAALMLYAAIAWFQHKQMLHEDSQWPWLFTLFAVLGVGHHASLIFMGAILFLFMVWVEPRWWLNLRRWPSLAGAIGLGLLPQLYLVWRGSVGAPGAPDDLATLSGFLNHITARGFQGDLFHFISWPDFGDRLRVMVEVYGFQWPAILLIAAIVGWLVLFNQQRPIAILLLLTTLAHTLITATYRAPQTVEYMLPAYLPWAISAAALPGLWPNGRRFLPRHNWRSYLWPMIGSAFALTIGWQILRLYPTFAQIRDDNDTRQYVDNLLEAAPENSTILADWHWATPLWYVTEIEGVAESNQVSYVFPTAESYGDTWARRIEEESTRPVIATHFDPISYANLPPPHPLLDGYLFDEKREPLQNSDSLNLNLADQLSVVNFMPLSSFARPGEPLSVWVEINNLGNGTLDYKTIFMHLVAQNGTIVAQQDISLGITPPEDVAGTLSQTRTVKFTLTPQIQALPGSYQLFIGAYHSLGGSPLPEVEAGALRSPVTVIDMLPQAKRPFTQNVTYRPDQQNSRILIGYDWDSTIASDRRLYLHWQVETGFITELVQPPTEGYLLPEWIGPWAIPLHTTLKPRESHYLPFGQGIVWLGPLRSDADDLQAGESVLLAGRWGSNRPVYRDIAVAMRIVGYERESDLWAWTDLDNRFGVPAMGAIPTLKWVNASVVYDTHRLRISPEALPGQRIGVSVGLYNTMTNENVPILDERFGNATPWYEAIVSGNR